MKYRLIIFKRLIEDIFIFPFIIYGRYLSRKKSLQQEYDVFLFFPFYHIGGAENVHQSIAKSLTNKKAIIIFTKRSHNDQLLSSFRESGHNIIDISAYTDNKKKYWNNLIYRGLVSGHINSQKRKPVVFNGQSNFAYKLSRWISKDIPQIELIHSFSSFSYIRVPFIFFYVKTIMISKKRIQDHLDMYEKWGMPKHFSYNIEYILNGIPLPNVKPLPKNNFNTPIHILYVGRGTEEKRIPLLAKIIHHLTETGLPVKATFVGDVIEKIPEDYKTLISFPGTINDGSILDSYYRDADIFLMASSTEGYPLCIMEAMARGCIIMSTGVGDISMQVIHQQNGFIFSNHLDENMIIQESEEFIRQLINEPELIYKISSNNIQYAFEHYGMNIFAEKYKKLFESYLN